LLCLINAQKTDKCISAAVFQKAHDRATA